MANPPTFEFGAVAQADAFLHFVPAQLLDQSPGGGKGTGASGMDLMDGMDNMDRMDLMDLMDPMDTGASHHFGHGGGQGDNLDPFPKGRT